MDQMSRDRDKRDFEALDRNEVCRMDDKQLATWQSSYQAGSAQWLLAEHEWQRRLTERQIAAARSANWRSVIGGIAGTSFGVLLGWWLSSESRNPPPNNGRDIPVQAQPKVPRESTKQQPVATPPPKQPVETVTPAQHPAAQKP